MADAVADAVEGFKNEGRDRDAISGRVSAHEILRTSERTEGAEAEKERLPTCPNQQMDPVGCFTRGKGPRNHPNRPGRSVNHASVPGNDQPDATCANCAALVTRYWQHPEALILQTKIDLVLAPEPGRPWLCDRDHDLPWARVLQGAWTE